MSSIEFPQSRPPRAVGRVPRLRAEVPSPDVARRTCLTCAREAPLPEFLDSPIWPEALGGKLAPFPFRSPALCRACRELAQVQIDGAFLKSWFMQAELARAAQAFLDPQNPGPAALAYLGTMTDVPVAEGEVCDRWAGLAGEAIYHIHAKQEDGWFGFGRTGDGQATPTEPGEVTLILASPSQYWSRIAVLSLAAHFPAAKRWCVDDFAALQGLDPGLAQTLAAGEGPFSQGQPGHQKVINSGLGEDFSPRFLIRLAMGLGDALFGAAYRTLAYARQLRRAFWQHKPQIRRFTGQKQSFAMQGAWTLTLAVAGDQLGLAIVTPTGRVLDIVIADDRALWASDAFDYLRAGTVHIAIPQRRLFAGPLLLGECLAHQSGARLHSGIARLEAMRVTPRQLPGKQGFA